MSTDFIGVQVQFNDSQALAASGLAIPKLFLLQVPAAAIPIAGDVIVLQDYLYADQSSVTVKVAYRAFGVCSKNRKYTPFLFVDLVPTLALGTG